MAGPTREFWEKRFQAGDTPWDRGAANPQLGVWLASGALKPCRILVPGCGSGHEVAVLTAAGFEVTGLDYAPAAIDRTRKLLDGTGLKATLVEADALA
jgi:SAM-dependent methyltransferase